ncbi:MAG: hypothetical protein ACTHOH_10530 [Lysobacteraceae bacterium]
MKWKFGVISVAMSLASSCASLQQAPLIYSSKASVGLDVSSSTTESPGGTINFGVKLVDAAYVPVAVSKKNGAGDEDTNKEIQRIEAVFGQGASNEGAAQLEEESRKRAQDVADASKRESESKSALDEKRKARAILESRVTEIEIKLTTLITKREELKASLGSAASDSPGFAEVIKEIDDLSAERDRKRNEIKIDSSEILDLEQRYQAAVVSTTRALDAAKKIADLSRVEKRDAMSVYGRFESTGAGNAGSLGANLTAGKIFSTGVASQNLTEGARYAALYDGVASCVREMASIYEKVKDADKSKVVEMIGRVCGPDALQIIEVHSK